MLCRHCKCVYVFSQIEKETDRQRAVYFVAFLRALSNRCVIQFTCIRYFRREISILPKYRTIHSEFRHIQKKTQVEISKIQFYFVCISIRFDSFFFFLFWYAKFISCQAWYIREKLFYVINFFPFLCLN